MSDDHDEGDEGAVRSTGSTQRPDEGTPADTTYSEEDEAIDDDAEEVKETDAQILEHIRRHEARYTRWLARQPDAATALHRERERQKLSLLEASYRAGISKSYLWRLERGERRGTSVMLFKLCACSYGYTSYQVTLMLEKAGYSFGFGPLPP